MIANARNKHVRVSDIYQSDINPLFFILKPLHL